MTAIPTMNTLMRIRYNNYEIQFILGFYSCGKVDLYCPLDLSNGYLIYLQWEI